MFFQQYVLGCLSGLMPSSALNGCLEVDEGAGARFAAHWDNLHPTASR